MPDSMQTSQFAHSTFHHSLVAKQQTALYCKTNSIWRPSLHSHNIHLHDKRSQSKVEILPGIVPPTKEQTVTEEV